MFDVSFDDSVNSVRTDVSDISDMVFVFRLAKGKTKSSNSSFSIDVGVVFGVSA